MYRRRVTPRGGEGTGHEDGRHVIHVMCLRHVIHWGRGDRKFPKWEVTCSSSGVTRLGTMYKNSGDSEIEKNKTQISIHHTSTTRYT